MFLGLFAQLNCALSFLIKSPELPAVLSFAEAEILIWGGFEDFLIYFGLEQKGYGGVKRQFVQTQTKILLKSL